MQRSRRTTDSYDSGARGLKFTTAPRPEGRNEAALQAYRRAELDALSVWLPKGARVLELGGADGFQAAQLQSMGCDTVAVDVQDYSSRRMHHPVALFDGVHIPAPAASFDIVFSSNVLEHAQRLDELLLDSRRVLRDGGRAVHILPSTAWRFWNLATHVPWLVVLASRKLRKEGRRHASPPSSDAARADRRTVSQTLGAILGTAPHGEYANSIVELYYYSRSAWRRVFERCGFRVLAEFDNELFYTGNYLLPALDVTARRKMSKLLGASCSVFVLAPR